MSQENGSLRILASIDKTLKASTNLQTQRNSVDIHALEGHGSKGEMEYSKLYAIFQSSSQYETYVYSYKKTQKERVHEHNFRRNAPGYKAKTSATSQIIHHYDSQAAIRADDVNEEQQTQNAERKYSPKREFIAYFDERDGKGFLKDSTDSTLQNMIKVKHQLQSNPLKWTTERNLNQVRKNAHYRIQSQFLHSSLLDPKQGVFSQNSMLRIPVSSTVDDSTEMNSARRIKEAMYTTHEKARNRSEAIFTTQQSTLDSCPLNLIQNTRQSLNFDTVNPMLDTEGNTISRMEQEGEMPALSHRPPMFKLKLQAGQEYHLKDREKLIQNVQQASYESNPMLRFQHVINPPEEPAGVSDDNVIVIPPLGGPRLIQSRLKRLQDKISPQTEYNREFQKQQQLFKDEKASFIKYEKREQKPIQRIPDEELDAIRSQKFKEVIEFNKGNPIFSAFGNTKRFRQPQRYEYYQNEVIPEIPSAKDIHAGKLDKKLDAYGEPTAEFGKQSARQPLFLSQEQIEKMAERKLNLRNIFGIKRRPWDRNNQHLYSQQQNLVTARVCRVNPF